MLKGNHEEMLLAALTSERAKNSWLMCGGVQTLNSYNFCGDIDVIPRRISTSSADCRDYYETADHLFVHANYLPDAPPPSGRRMCSAGHCSMKTFPGRTCRARQSSSVTPNNVTARCSTWVTSNALTPTATITAG